MRLLAMAMGTSLLVAACGGAAQPSPSPTAAATTAAPATTAPATPAPTPATQVTFTAELKTENEVPPISNEEMSGSGMATVTFDLTRSATGAITAATASFEIVLSGFPTSTMINVGHIHEAEAGANGGVVVGFKTDGANPIALTTGGTTLTYADITVDPALAQEILDDPDGYYVNVHSAANPGGVVRGQLTTQ
ncbi:MAG: CHRD domain-containing protein [Candidatus Limnocylindria bacterium]